MDSSPYCRENLFDCNLSVADEWPGGSACRRPRASGGIDYGCSRSNRPQPRNQGTGSRPGIRPYHPARAGTGRVPVLKTKMSPLASRGTRCLPSKPECPLWLRPVRLSAMAGRSRSGRRLGIRRRRRVSRMYWRPSGGNAGASWISGHRGAAHPMRKSRGCRSVVCSTRRSIPTDPYKVEPSCRRPCPAGDVGPDSTGRGFADQTQGSSETISPPARVPSPLQAGRATPSLIAATCPSRNTQLTMPGWTLFGGMAPRNPS